MGPLLKNFLSYGQDEYKSMRLGLDRIRQVLEVLDHPERAFPSVLIAGTNGKGSVGRILELVLLEAGHEVGLYTSPHLESFTERIRLRGREVDEELLEAILELFQGKGLLKQDGYLETPAGEKLTWFEKTTVLAFEVFRRKKISLALLEVGLGGRLDATNVVDPLVSVITSISSDHTEVLGDSLFDIAREKLGVMRPGKPLIIGPMDTKLRTFLSKAARMGEAKPVLPPMPRGTWEAFSYGPFQNLKLGLRGDHQLKNAATAIETLVELKRKGFEVNNQELKEGLAKVKYPGRMEWFEGQPPVLMDGAHNRESIQSLVHELKKWGSEKKIFLILGMMEGKDLLEVIGLLRPHVEKFFLSEIKSPRSITLEKSKAIAESQAILAECFTNSKTAFQSARQEAGDEGVLVVTGSIYLVGELRKLFNGGSLDGVRCDSSADG